MLLQVEDVVHNRILHDIVCLPDEVFHLINALDLFLAAASLLLCSFLKCFFGLVIYNKY